jgi:hypothetical protein
VRAGFYAFKAAFASLRVIDAGMLMEEQVHFAEDLFRTCFAAFPACFASPGVQFDVNSPMIRFGNTD